MIYYGTSDPEQDLAFAFLKHKWVFFIRPYYGRDIRCGVYVDKKRFLLN